MRTIHIGTIALAALLAAPLVAHAETVLKKVDVPAPVLETVRQTYAGAKQTGYSKEVEGGTTLYEVRLLRGHDRLEVSLQADGKIASEETETRFAALPRAVRGGFRGSRYAAWKVGKVERIITAGDTAKPTWELALRRGRNAVEARFDAAGKLIKDEAVPAAP